MYRRTELITFKKDIDTDKRSATIQRLQYLPNECPSIIAWYVGENVLPGENAADVITQAEFGNKAKLKEFLGNPAREELNAHLGSVATVLAITSEWKP